MGGNVTGRDFRPGRAAAMTFGTRKGELSAADKAALHRAGSAWTDMGTARHVAGGPGHSSSAIRCHWRAVRLLGELPVHEDTGYLADLGAAWVNLGCALLAGYPGASPEEALGAFGSAVELLGRLPFDANPRFRHNLAAAWMGRGEAFGRIETTSGRAAALHAYGRAIEIARELPLDERPSFRVLLASCRINRGNLLQRLSRHQEAIQEYDESLSALGSLPRCGHRLASHHAATAWTNRGEALLCLSDFAGSTAAVESARMALGQVEGRGFDGPPDAKISLRALCVMARGLESRMLLQGFARGADEVAALSDVAERGLALAFASRDRAPETFDPLIIWFFSFGGRVYGRFQPQFLAEYLGEALSRCQADAELGAELRAVARRAAAGTLEGLCRNRIIIAGTREAERLLSTVRELEGAAANF